jgi:hypothetical protein
VKRFAFALVLASAGLALLVGRSTAASSNTVVVKLPKHVWGHFQQADLRDVDAKWGNGPGQVGLEHAEDGPRGGSSFDVVQGIVCVLDQHNSRVLVFDPRKKPRAIPLKVTGLPGSIFRGVDSSLAVGADGTIYVLEPVDSIHHVPTLRSFRPTGGAALATTSAGGAIAVRAAGKVAYVGNPVDVWQRTMTAGKLDRGKAVPYRPYADGSQIHVSTSGLVTLKRSDKTTLSWRIAATSPDHVSVANAESFGGIEAVVALRVNRDGKRTEYEVLILGPHGILQSFSAPDDEYTTTALDDDWRVEGSTIYHRGSTPKGLYVDEYQF